MLFTSVCVQRHNNILVATKNISIATVSLRDDCMLIYTTIRLFQNYSVDFSILLHVRGQTVNFIYFAPSRFSWFIITNLDSLGPLRNFGSVQMRKVYRSKRPMMYIMMSVKNRDVTVKKRNFNVSFSNLGPTESLSDSKNFRFKNVLVAILKRTYNDHLKVY